MPSFGPVESACSVYKRSRIGEKEVFHWDMLNANGSSRKETFQFNEIVEVYAHPKDVQELQLDILLSFVQKMKDSNILVVHINTGNSLMTTLVQSGEDMNPLIVDLDRRGRLKGISINSPVQLYAALDLLQYTLHTDTDIGAGAVNTAGDSLREEPPSHVLLLLDHIESLLPLSQSQPLNMISNSNMDINIPAKLAQLVDNQAVLCFTLRSLSSVPATASATFKTLGSGAGRAGGSASGVSRSMSIASRTASGGSGSVVSVPVSRSFNYHPRIDTVI